MKNRADERRSTMTTLTVSVKI